MKHSWIAYAATGVIAAGAGIAIAGLPSTPEGADLVVTALPSTSTSTSTTTLPATTTSEAAEPATTTTAPTTTTVRSTTTTAVTTSTVAPLLDRAGLAIGVANATDRAGVAGSNADALRAVGYANVTPVDTTPSATTSVFYAEGLDGEAARLAADVGLDPTLIAPITQAPTLATENEFQLLLIVGLDRV